MPITEIRLSLDDTVLPIPYSATEDGQNIGYRSLISEPNAIEQFPELHGEASMTEFIRSINLPGGVFETVRMAHWFNESEGNARRVFMVGIIFRDRTLFSTYSNCLMLLGNLLQHTHSGAFTPDQPFLLEMQPAVIRAEHAHGWVMDLYVCGHGVDKDTARQRLDDLLRRMIPFLYTGGAAPS